MTTKESNQPREPSPYHEFNTGLGAGFWGNWNQKPFPVNIRKLEYYLLNPIAENKALRDLAWWAFTTNGVIRNVVDYMTALPTLDRIIFSKDRISGKKPEGYERNKNTFLSVLDRIKDKELVRDSIQKNCNDGVSFYYFTTETKLSKSRYINPLMVTALTQLNEKNDINCSLFALPVDYCKIVSIKNNAYEIAFDLSYFDQFMSNGRSKKLMTYPREIREAWKTASRSSGLDKWFVLDNTKTVVTKIGAKIEEPWGRPISAAALCDIMYYNYFVDTKRNTLDSINNKVLFQTFPEGREKGTSALSGRQQEDQHNMIKNALNSRKEGQWGQSFFSLAAGTKLDVLNTDTEIFDDKNETGLTDRIAGDVGFGAALLNGVSQGNYSTLKLNLELVSAQVFSWVRQFQTELNKVINYNIIKDPNCYMEIDYLPMTHVNKNDMITYMKDLYLQGKGSWAAWVSSTGLNFDSFIAMLEDEKDMDYENRFPVHKTSYTLRGEDSVPSDSDYSGGRPEIKDTTNDNTIQSKSNDGNSMPRANV